MSEQLIGKVTRGGATLALCVAAVAANALLAGCGGGGEGLLVPSETAAQQQEREQAALQRAMELNKAALAAPVKGERATQQ